MGNSGLDVRGEPRRLSPDKKLTMFRIVQEALTNVEKYSRETRAVITMAYQPSNLEITVCGNGRGFDVAQFSREKIAREKLGIVGMQERAALLGGTLRIDSQRSKGTQVQLRVEI